MCMELVCNRQGIAIEENGKIVCGHCYVQHLKDEQYHGEVA